MARINFDYSHSKTYKTQDNADKAVIAKGFDDLRYFLQPTADGRWFPVFIGEAAMQRGVHFHFHTVN